MNPPVLVVDDDEDMCQMLARGLTKSGYETVSRQSGVEALELLGSREFDAVITDVRMRELDGIDLCRRIAERRPDLPVIVITAFGSMETAIEALRAGAYDFLPKPFDLDAMRTVVERAVRHHDLRRRVERIEQPPEAVEFESLFGASPEMRRVYELVNRVADTEAAVLVSGESGTGKELVARAIHRRSARREGPFVAVNCAAMPGALLESELFGHVKGAFTDARGDRKGLFLEANGGTLFLDEIGELPTELQPKLLRALQERSVRPVGSSNELPFDARIVSATHRDLEADVRERRFREDLFYRVHVVPIELPPLRRRGDDVLLLAQRFLERFAAQLESPVRGIRPQAAERLLAYSWPGNVRELRNCIECAVAVGSYGEIALEDLPERVRDPALGRRALHGEAPEELATMEEVERRHVLRVIEATRGNKSLAARLLGFDRKTLYRKLRRYGALEEGLG